MNGASATVRGLYRAASEAANIPVTPETFNLYNYSYTSSPLPLDVPLCEVKLGNASLVHARLRVRAGASIACMYISYTPFAHARRPTISSTVPVSNSTGNKRKAKAVGGGQETQANAGFVAFKRRRTDIRQPEEGGQASVTDDNQPRESQAVIGEYGCLSSLLTATERTQCLTHHLVESPNSSSGGRQLRSKTRREGDESILPIRLIS